MKFRPAAFWASALLVSYSEQSCDSFSLRRQRNRQIHRCSGAPLCSALSVLCRGWLGSELFALSVRGWTSQECVLCVHVYVSGTLGRYDLEKLERTTGL